MSEDKPSLEALLDHYDVQYSAMRRRQMVRCPLHEDRTPSCSVDLDKQLVRCHSCNFGGDAWSLIQQMEDTDFNGAREWADATLSDTARVAGGGDGEVRGSRYGGRRRVAPRKGDKPGGGGFVPSWRRR